MLRTIGEGLLRREEDSMGKGQGVPERLVRIAVEGVDRRVEVVDLMVECGVRNRLKGKLNLIEDMRSILRTIWLTRRRYGDERRNFSFLCYLQPLQDGNK